MSGAPSKYPNAVQMQLRLPQELKGRIQQRADDSSPHVSVNQIVVDALDREFTATLDQLGSAAGTLRALSPWYAQLTALKSMPKEISNRVFLALCGKGQAAIKLLPAGFSDMTQVEKAGWLDVNFPLGAL